MQEAAMAASSGYNQNNQDEDLPTQEKTPAEWQKFWKKELDACTKRLRTFTRQGNKVNQKYLGAEAGGAQYDENDLSRIGSDGYYHLNLFHTNVKTLQNMLFGRTPQVDVSREHQDPDDDVARVASVIFKRMLEADVAPSGDGFATAIKSALQDRLLPGLGTARVRYEFEAEEQEVINPSTGETTVTEMLTGEYAPIDYVNWQDFIWGWCRTWSECPWLGYRSWMTKDECIARFGKEKSRDLQYKNQLPSGDDKNDDAYDPEQQNNVQKAEVWEFWCKDNRRVFWWSDGVDTILDMRDDPLQLDGFWPSPMPMMANVTTSLWVPKADFVMAQDLYNEVDVLQTRIAIITRAIKVVGVYDKNAGPSVGRMLKEGSENDLIPVDNWALFAEKGGLKGQIDWFPVETIVNVLNVLQAVRDQTIELLYQVTGMSDVLRGGNTDQYVAEGTQQLKAKFGSVSVQALQEDFARFASDLDGLKSEVISKHFSPESIMVQSSAKFLPAPDLDKIQPALQLIKSPEIKWRVNIRPESIAMIDYAALKQERTDYLMSMAQFIQSASGLVQDTPEAMPVVLEMLKWGMAGFKGADYLEGIMDTAIEMAKNAPEKPDQKQQAEQMKQQAEQMKMQMEMQKIQAKSQADMQIIQAKQQAAMQEEALDHQNKMQQAMAEAQADSRAVMEGLQADLAVIRAKLEADLQVEQAQSTFAAAETEIEHGYKMKEIEESGEMAARQQDGQADTD